MIKANKTNEIKKEVKNELEKIGELEFKTSKNNNTYYEMKLNEDRYLGFYESAEEKDEDHKNTPNLRIYNENNLKDTVIVLWERETKNKESVYFSGYDSDKEIIKGFYSKFKDNTINLFYSLDEKGNHIKSKSK